MYIELQNYGFTLIFKETVMGENKQVKGNCDADLVLRVTRDTYEDNYDEAVIVSSDGDFASLIRFINGRNRLKIVASPHTKCSMLIRQMNLPLVYLNELRILLETSPKKKKPPMRTEPH